MSEIAMTEPQINLIKSTVAKGATNDELALFLHQCQKTGLDPLGKQIYFVKRGNSSTIQAGIDGLRAIADRTNCYAPGEEAFEWDKDHPGFPVSASVSVKKFVQGTWHEFSCSARWEEYAAYYGNKLAAMWEKFPTTMLAKCAESKALRKAFPAQLAGLYSNEEMQQADGSAPTPKKAAQGNLVALEGIPENGRDKTLEPGIDPPTEAERVADALRDQLMDELLRVSDGKKDLMADLLEMASEWRLKDGTLKQAGSRELDGVSFIIREGRKMAQAEMVIKQLNKIKDLDNAIEQVDLWKAAKDG